MKHTRVHTYGLNDCVQIIEYLPQLIQWQLLSSSCSEERTKYKGKQTKNPKTIN